MLPFSICDCAKINSKDMVLFLKLGGRLPLGAHGQSKYLFIGAAVASNQDQTLAQDQVTLPPKAPI